jgi:hypothetical protein
MRNSGQDFVNRSIAARSQDQLRSGVNRPARHFSSDARTCRGRHRKHITGFREHLGCPLQPRVALPAQPAGSGIVD